ncbi:MAG: hypothetical protein ACTSRZ_20990, partial [Promethearchaeota archaeon]
MGILGKYPISPISFAILVIVFLFHLPVNNERLKRINKVNFIFFYYIFLLYIIIQIVITYVKFGNFFNVVSGSIVYIYYFSFLMYLIILQKYSIEKIDKFIRIILFITIIQTILYLIQNYFSLPVFPKENIYTIYHVNGHLVQRIFKSFPVLLPFSFYYYFFNSNNKLKIIFLIIFWGAIIASLTRHIIGIYFAQFLLIMFLEKQGFLEKFKRSFVNILSVIIVIFLLSYFAPYYFELFLNR